MTDDELIAAFESQKLDSESFPHGEHVRLAWLYLGRHDYEDALSRFRSGLKKLTKALGDPEKYHETITCFYMEIVRDRRTQSSAKYWQDFVAENPDLIAKPPIITRYYSRAALASNRARQSCIPPDIQGQDP